MVSIRQAPPPPTKKSCVPHCHNASIMFSLLTSSCHIITSSIHPSTICNRLSCSGSRAYGQFRVINLPRMLVFGRREEAGEPRRENPALPRGRACVVHTDTYPSGALWLCSGHRTTHDYTQRKPAHVSLLLHHSQQISRVDGQLLWQLHSIQFNFQFTLFCIAHYHKLHICLRGLYNLCT